jgi:hypothetical protein
LDRIGPARTEDGDEHAGQGRARLRATLKHPR